VFASGGVFRLLLHVLEKQSIRAVSASRHGGERLLSAPPRALKKDRENHFQSTNRSARSGLLHGRRPRPVARVSHGRVCGLIGDIF